MQTPLYHASIPGGPTGLSFQIGETLIFAPTFEERIYIMAHPTDLFCGSMVEPAMADFLVRTIIEPRLAQLGRVA
jgi:hypothetical protein